MEPQGSLSSPQEPSTGSYPERDKSCLQLPILLF